MKTIQISMASLLLIISVWGCSKSNNSDPTNNDYASVVSGTFTGKMNWQDTIPASITLIKQTNNTVILRLTDDGGSMDYAGVVVSDGGSSKYLLSKSDGHPSISGTVEGKHLDCYFGPLHFWGNKP